MRSDKMRIAEVFMNEDGSYSINVPQLDNGYVGYDTIGVLNDKP